MTTTQSALEGIRILDGGEAEDIPEIVAFRTRLEATDAGCTHLDYVTHLSHPPAVSLLYRLAYQGPGQQCCSTIFGP